MIVSVSFGWRLALDNEIETTLVILLASLSVSVDYNVGANWVSVFVPENVAAMLNWHLSAHNA